MFHAGTYFIYEHYYNVLIFGLTVSNGPKRLKNGSLSLLSAVYPKNFTSIPLIFHLTPKSTIEGSTANFEGENFLDKLHLRGENRLPSHILFLLPFNIAQLYLLRLLLYDDSYSYINSP